MVNIKVFVHADMTRKRDLKKTFLSLCRGAGRGGGMAPIDFTNIEKRIEGEIDNLLVVASLELPPPLLLCIYLLTYIISKEVTIYLGN